MSPVAEPRHMAPREYVVVCGGAELRHHSGAFGTPEAAHHWADTAHCCPGRHQVVRAGALADLGGRA